MKKHTTMYDLLGHSARIGGLSAALVVLVLGAFHGVAGWTLAVRVGTVFVAVTAVLNLLGYVTIRSLLAGVAADEGTRKRESSGGKKA